MCIRDRKHTARCRGVSFNLRFESRVVLDGSEPAEPRTRALEVFESRVVLDGSEPYLPIMETLKIFGKYCYLIKLSIMLTVIGAMCYIQR